ncbi:MAG: hypothetical protein A2381_07805 [Bdellovibrionales bacterium RIFOXYB1_FULL_37_110]|nr:MAG: hypothetical protein A2181_04570 [Bdellovibrionales bacterium RIFOXYA1_FULL_38_20]OFZ52508.1 MAG: hypothetical protein A2417_00525 [Bdellovibrionales bacterium RIFOXYC1_FULL_37_79]OFZ59710.1 MAG: hypothetical protein A2381_07805 [Bdellovibrionales bacterium RIFOXYB1_FULL_37_110]OFZ62637.1 MAG: hypothetical protein A2577_12125 [Bdellovibrionales bacterium RIFOXYD1_FULL_36_51]OFZ66679.1 MAG: hypothetical protein A2328_04600 [Bdellovibrionales bacterium RIFOXYB2_FULL_36_6]
MNSKKEIGFCFLDEYANFEIALKSVFECSKSYLKKIIGNKKKLSQKVYARREYAIDLNLVNHLMINPIYCGKPLAILFQDENYLVLNKIPGIHAHPHFYDESDNCLSFLRQEFDPKILEVNKNFYDRGLLFRLDLVTSGVLVYVKKEILLKKLRDQYEDLVKKKTYLAVVEGQLEQAYHLTHYFRKSQFKGKKMSVTDHDTEGAKPGICMVNPLKFNREENVSLVKIELKTGLRHQIRAQLAHLGFPILGDELYGGKKAPRVFLHAYNYEINVPGTYLNVFSKDPSLFDIFFDLDTCL